MKRLLAMSGRLMLTSLAILVGSGVVLSFWYVPVGETAYASVVAITQHPVLSIVRSIHYWTADVFFILVILHLTRVVVQHTLKQKRLAYWSGVALLALVATELLLGTFLRSDQEAYEAYAHFLVATGITASLLQFFVLHIAVIPLAIIGIISLHALWANITIIRQVRLPQWQLWWKSSLGLVLLIINLAVLVPAPLWDKAYGGIEITQPPWYLLWVYGLENIGGISLILVGPVVMFGVLAVLPLMQRFTRSIYLLLVGAVASLSLYALLVGAVSHLV